MRLCRAIEVWLKLKQNSNGLLPFYSHFKLYHYNGIKEYTDSCIITSYNISLRKPPNSTIVPLNQTYSLIFYYFDILFGV